MTAPPDDQTPGARVATGAIGLAIAILFGSLLVLILRSPPSPGTPTWSNWLISTFVLSMFGTMTGLGLYGFVTAVRGPRVSPLPHALLARCGACGEPVAPSTAVCPGCGRAPGRVGRSWSETPRDGAGAGLMMGGMGTAITSLGLFLLVSALSGEEGLALSLASGALSLLLLAVGLLMLFGGLLTLRDGLRHLGQRSFTLSDYEHAVTYSAGAEISWRSTSLRGTTVTSRPFAEAPDPPALEGSLDPAIRALVRAVAVLHARGEIELFYVDTLEWTAGAEGPPSRTKRADVEAGRRFDDDPEGEEPEERVVPEGPLDPVRALLVEGSTVRAIAFALAGDEGLRNLVETYAAELPPGEADPRTTRILGAMLAGGGAGAPYRQPG